MNTNEVRPKNKTSSPQTKASLSPTSRTAKFSPSRAHSGSCGHTNSLTFHACCLMIECQECNRGNSSHECPHLNNKHSFPVRQASSHPAMADGTLENMRKCSRCQFTRAQLEYCLQCKHHFCSHCAQELHSKGKFILHVRLPTTVDKDNSSQHKWHSSA